MGQINVRHLQQNASSILRRLQRGERIEITARGRPVAVLSPLAPANVREALEAAGRLTRAEEDLLDLPAPIRIPADIERPSRWLEKLRATER